MLAALAEIAESLQDYVEDTASWAACAWLSLVQCLPRAQRPLARCHSVLECLGEVMRQLDGDDATRAAATLQRSGHWLVNERLMRTDNIGLSLIRSLRGGPGRRMPAAKSAAFAIAATGALVDLAVQPHDRPELLRLGAVPALATVVGWHSADAAVCKAVCELLVLLTAAHAALGDGASASSIWTGIVQPILSRHCGNDEVAAPALQALAYAIVIQPVNGSR